MLWLFLAIGIVTLASSLYAVVDDARLRLRVARGRASAAEVASYLRLSSLLELDALRRDDPSLLSLVPGPPARYEALEFRFTPQRLRAHRRRPPLATLRSPALFGVVLLLLIAAWAAGHGRVMGWTALLAAFFIELLRWTAPFVADARAAHARAAGRKPAAPAAAPRPGHALSPRIESPQPSSSGTANAPADESAVATSSSDALVSESGADQTAARASDSGCPPATAESENTPEDVTASEDEASPGAKSAVLTAVLLAAPWKPVPNVLLASLRRCGQRDAVLMPSAGQDSPVIIRAAGATLEIAACAEPIRPSVSAFAIQHAWDWPEAADAVAAHAAHATVTSCSEPSSSRFETVRLHQRAHAALAEFARVVAVLWPESGRLVAPAGVRSLAASNAADPAIDGFITFRTYAPAETGAETTVCDSVGLHAFALPDVQCVTPDAPDEEVSRLVHGLVCAFLADGCRVLEGDVLTDGRTRRWRAANGRSAFPPPRAVITLTPEA